MQSTSRNAGLEETQAGIKIAGRNINNLRYADDTTLMAESEEELQSLLMKVKVESEKVGFKLNIQKMKIMASGPCFWPTSVFFLYLKGSSGCDTSYAPPCVGKWDRKLIFKVQRDFSSPLLGEGYWAKEKASFETRPSAECSIELCQRQCPLHRRPGLHLVFCSSALSHPFLNHSCP